MGMPRKKLYVQYPGDPACWYETAQPYSAKIINKLLYSIGYGSTVAEMEGITEEHDEQQVLPICGAGSSMPLSSAFELVSDHSTIIDVIMNNSDVSDPFLSVAVIDKQVTASVTTNLAVSMPCAVRLSP